MRAYSPCTTFCLKNCNSIESCRFFFTRKYVHNLLWIFRNDSGTNCGTFTLKSFLKLFTKLSFKIATDLWKVAHFHFSSNYPKNCVSNFLETFPDPTLWMMWPDATCCLTKAKESQWIYSTIFPAINKNKSLFFMIPTSIHLCASVFVKKATVVGNNRKITTHCSIFKRR